MAPDETGQAAEPPRPISAETGIAAPGESADRLPEGFEETVVMRLVAIPREQSIHRTLQALAQIGYERGMTVAQMRKFFLTNQHIAEQFAIDLGDVMEARLSLPRTVPMTLPRESIERAVRGMIDYFLEHVVDGSLYDHIGNMEASWPPDTRDDLHAILGSERFQEIVVRTFRSFVGIILNRMCPSLEAVQDEVRESLGQPLHDSGMAEPPEDVPPPFDLISQFQRNGVPPTSQTAYIDACLRGGSDNTLHKCFYWSAGEERAYLGSARRRERAAREASEAVAPA